MIWYGELTTQTSLLKRGLVFLFSGMLWLMVFLVLPGLVLVVVSFATRGAYGQLEWEFTIENYKRLMGFSLFGWTADYLVILWRSVVVAFITTLVSVILSYPLCFFIAAFTSLPLWFFTHDPLWAVLVLTTVDLLGFGPTLRKAYHHPNEEGASLFAIYAFRNLLVLGALEHYSLTTILFPAAIAAACLGVVLLIIYRRGRGN